MKFLSILPLLALCGCLQLQSKITIAGASFALPKDSQIGSLNIEIPTTNGVIRFQATNCVWKNNPDLVNAQTAHDVAVINATASGIGSVAGAAAKVMAKP